jgi:hypothetical protein
LNIVVVKWRKYIAVYVLFILLPKLSSATLVNAITSVCAVLAVISTIVEAFAVLALEYCDGENLTQFYWAFWGLIQVGACIALIGLAVYHIRSLNDKDHPPWMIALGTPVLVIAGLGHLLVLGVRALLRKYMRSGFDGPEIPVSWNLWPRILFFLNE